jgi:cystathionine beta-lyase
MKYNFDEIVPRRGSHSVKWDATATDAEVLPMWVADMDFRTAPAVVDALRRRVEHGVFGYGHVPPAYYQAVIDWFGRRHGLTIRQEWILYTSGVVPALSAIIRALTQPGDQILLQTPVYNCFFSSIRNLQCKAVMNELIYRDGVYRIDFNDFEEKAADPQTKLFLLCSPHNPVGRVWTRDELQQMGEICRRHQVTVVSDEIHCDLVYPGHTHIPFASLSEDFLQHTVTCTSPSKTFNIAGIQAANILVKDEELRQRINRALNIHEICDINVFAIEALTAAYNEGEAWLEELKMYLYANYQTLTTFFRQSLPHLQVLPLEATYLVWVDCTALGQSSETIANALLEKEQLRINEGTMYGAAGEGFIRINIATCRARLMEGLQRIGRLYRS